MFVPGGAVLTEVASGQIHGRILEWGRWRMAVRLDIGEKRFRDTTLGALFNADAPESQHKRRSW